MVLDDTMGPRREIVFEQTSSLRVDVHGVIGWVRTRMGLGLFPFYSVKKSAPDARKLPKEEMEKMISSNRR